MNDLQKTGGVAALIAAATYLVGFALLFTLLIPAGYGSGGNDPIQSVAFLAENQTVMYIWNLIIWIVNSIVLVVLALALYERLKDGSPALAQIATAFGLIWAGLILASGMVANVGLNAIVALYSTAPDQAASLWLALSTVENGLGGGNEIAGGVWVLLVSLAALRAEVFPKVLNILGVVIGISGLLTVVPILGDLGAVFGLGLIVWFIWMGVVLLRKSPSAAAKKATAMGQS